MSVEAVDPVFQTNMLEMLKQTGRSEMVVGWYHSHPGFGCWLSGVDMNTQTSFEQLNARAVSTEKYVHFLFVKLLISLSTQILIRVLLRLFLFCAHCVCMNQVAVVVDPVQSVKGKVVIDAFRMIPGAGQMMMMAPTEPRQTTSHVGFLKKPTIQARIHGLDRHYYSLVIDWRKNDLEEQMLMNLHKKDWTTGMVIQKFEEHQKHTAALLDQMTRLSKDYCARVKEEEGRTQEEVDVMNVGKVDPKRHLENDVNDLMACSIIQCLGTMIETVVF